MTEGGKMDVNQMTTGPELDALMATEVMEWTLSPDGEDWLDNNRNRVANAEDWIVQNCWDASKIRWSPSVELNETWQVHQLACSWPYAKNQTYFKALQDQASIGWPGMIGWPDVLTVLSDKMPLSICRAALQVACDEKAGVIFDSENKLKKPLTRIIEQLLFCEFQSTGSALENNSAFLELCRMADVEIPTEYGIVSTRVEPKEIK